MHFCPFLCYLSRLLTSEFAVSCLVARFPVVNLEPTVLVEYADDIRRMVHVAGARGFLLAERDAASVWLDYSNGQAAGWLRLPLEDDALFAVLLVHSLDASAPSLEPPVGYALWLEFAAEFLEFYSAAGSRVARAELEYLRMAYDGYL